MAEVSHLTWLVDVIQTHSKPKLLYEAPASAGWHTISPLTFFCDSKEYMLNIYSVI